MSQRTFSLRLSLATGLIGLCAAAALAVNVETVPVGNAGNLPDTRYASGSFGGVNYPYSIGKYEVTAGQYTEFLNAVAQTDPYGLYNPYMADSTVPRQGCNIQRTSGPDGYSYSVAGDWANRPVNYVSWGDAVRFANWMQNGQPTGPGAAASTEDGSYTLHGYTDRTGLMSIRRNSATGWVLASEDEWYKAAYHKNDGPTGNYWDYPTRTNSIPSNVVADPDPGNNANYYDRHHTGNDGASIGNPYARTVVGEFENSYSPYGTFDQGGNVFEWTEGIYMSSRVYRGGCFGGDDTYLKASFSGHFDPSYDDPGNGFRLVLLPEPATLALLALAAGVLVRPRRPGRHSQF